jgi:3-hydroxybutyryl-CoA dehydrogenase
MAVVDVLDVKRVVVVGAGTMGAGIAQTILAAGYAVHLVDTRAEALEAARTGLLGRFTSLFQKEKIKETPENILARLTVGTIDDAPPFELFIEAVAEILEVKTAVFLAGYQKQPDATFASNTSSLSINALGEVFPAPAQFFGLHFFNPAPLMPLVEVIEGAQTAPEVLALGTAFCKKLGKTPVSVKDSPGFIVNRVARPFYAEAMRITQEASLSFEGVDTAMRSQGFKMGPYQLMDMIGLDINYNVTRLVWEGLGKPARFTPNTLQGSRVEAGQLGVKTKLGFYAYTESK